MFSEFFFITAQMRDDPLASPHWQHFKKYVVPKITLFSTFYLIVLLWWLTFSTILLVVVVVVIIIKKGGLCCRCCCACFCLYNCCVTSSTLYWRMQSCRRQIGESSPGGSLSKVTIGRYTRFLSTLCSSGTQWSSNHHSFFIGFNCLVCRLLFFQATATSTTGGAQYTHSLTP